MTRQHELHHVRRSVVIAVCYWSRIAKEQYLQAHFQVTLVHDALRKVGSDQVAGRGHLERDTVNGVSVANLVLIPGAELYVGKQGPLRINEILKMQTEE